MGCPSLSLVSLCRFGHFLTHSKLVLVESRSIAYPFTHRSHSVMDDLHDAQRLSEQARHRSSTWVKPVGHSSRQKNIPTAGIYFLYPSAHRVHLVSRQPFGLGAVTDFLVVGTGGNVTGGSVTFFVVSGFGASVIVGLVVLLSLFVFGTIAVLV